MHIYTHVQLIHVLSSLAVLVLPDVGIRQKTRCGKVENGSEQRVLVNSTPYQVRSRKEEFREKHGREADVELGAAENGRGYCSTQC